jgi:UDP-N-acetyl-2-amino-2-deoxyglucuronate dehydrogenase
MSETLKLALVGCGAISEWHRMAIEHVPEIAITAAVDPDLARAKATAEATGAQAFSSLEAALEHGDLDACDLMLPHHLHESVAIAALESGKHVILEKPMASTPEACDRILAAAKRAPGVFMLAENAQYWPEVLIAKQLIDDGAIGDVITARAQLIFPPMPAYYGERDGQPSWRLDKREAGGGVSIDTGSHYLRPLRIWLGEIDEVVASMARPYEAMQGESLVRSLLRFRSGLVASFDLLLSQAPIAPQDMFRITGSDGEIVIGLKVMLYNRENPRGVAVAEETPQGYMLSYRGQFADFANAALRGQPLAAPPEDSLGELYTALALERSAASGRWEKVWR